MKLSAFGDLWTKLESGGRLTREDGYRMMRSSNVRELGWMANQIKTRRHGNRFYYTHSINVNYTNVCVLTCKFCAFSRTKKEPDAYVWEVPDIVQKVRNAARHGVWEVHIVGGLHADLPLSYYESMLSEIKKACPGVLIQAFTAVELDFIGRIEKMDIREVLARLQRAGLGGIPGGGAEIFAPRARNLVCATKITAERWLEVHRHAHALGFRSNATLLYGHIETPEERVDHMVQLRDAQDVSGGYLAFVPLAYQTENNELQCPRTTGMTDLKVLAVSRLILDNFDHIRQLWNYVDEKLIHAALKFGVDDLGGTNFDETIAKEAGSRESGFTSEELARMIRRCGGEPVECNSTYTPILKDELVAA